MGNCNNLDSSANTNRGFSKLKPTNFKLNLEDDYKNHIFTFGEEELGKKIIV